MNLGAIEEDLLAATDALWPSDPIGRIAEATKFEMHDKLVQYISTHYADACVRDALIFSTNTFFASPDLAKRDLLLTPDMPAHLSPAERRGLTWKGFVKSVTKPITDITNAISREVGKVIDAASGLITQAVCATIGATAASLTATPAVTAPAAPYVGTAVYFWCLGGAEKEIKKAVAKENVRKWKSSKNHRGEELEVPSID
jgi:hypothetical protein